MAALSLEPYGNHDEYTKVRANLISQAYVSRFDRTVREGLTPEEHEVNKWLCSLRDEETASLLQAGKFPPMLHFSKAKEVIENTLLFEIIKKLPKGGILHAHFDSLVDVRWLIKHATYMPDCYIAHDKVTDTLEFRFFHTPPEDEEHWVPVSEARQAHTGGAEGFDEFLYNKLTLFYDLPDLELWPHFQNTFSAAAGLITYLPVFKEYNRLKLQKLVEDKVQYIEERIVGVATRLYDMDQEYPMEYTFQLYQEIVNDFKTEHSQTGVKFIGAKLIYSTVRFFDDKMVSEDLDKALELRKKYPDLIAGFDIVAHEDQGYPLLYYSKEILRAKLQAEADGDSLPFFWHAGETVAVGTPADENLYDAVLLGCKRIGHGFAITKHQQLQEVVKQQDICIEACPISNQVLKYVCDDLRLHPIIELLMNGVPVVIAPDDPAIFGVADHLSSYDYFQVFMAWKTLDLASLKKLVWNTIDYSAMDDEEKKVAFEVLQSEWDKFIQWVTMKYVRGSKKLYIRYR